MPSHQGIPIFSCTKGNLLPSRRGIPTRLSVQYLLLFDLAVAPLWEKASSIWPHRRTSLAISSSIWPHRRASLVISSSIQPYHHAFLVILKMPILECRCLISILEQPWILAALLRNLLANKPCRNMPLSCTFATLSGFSRQKQDCLGGHLLFCPYPLCATLSAFFANLEVSAFGRKRSCLHCMGNTGHHIFLLPFGVSPYFQQTMLYPDWRKLKAASFIHAGVAFLATPGDQPLAFASFLVLYASP